MTTSSTGRDPLAANGVYDRQQRLLRDGRRWDQQRLHETPVLLVGLGNIGEPLAVMLARLGFRDITGVDSDLVSWANLSRGVLYQSEDVGRPKAEVLAERPPRLAPEVRFRPIVGDVRFDVGDGDLRSAALVLLATHDFSSRRDVNRRVHLLPGATRAIIEGAIGVFSFSVQTILPHRTHCYECPLPAGLPDDGVRTGCTGVTVAVQEAPAATNGPDGMAVAALMAREAGLLGAGLRPFFAGAQLRSSAQTGAARVMRPEKRESCEGHRRADPATILLLDFTNTTPIAAIRARAAASLRCEPHQVALYPPRRITARLRCDCGETVPVWRAQAAPLQPRCPACAASDPNQFAADLVDDLMDEDPRMCGAGPATPAGYGIPPRQSLVAAVGERSWYLVPLAGG
jgi:adenylyltransferase/sulfurtransferase